MSIDWLETLLLDVPMRGVVAVERGEQLVSTDARFEAYGVVLVTERGRLVRSVRKGDAWMGEQTSYVEEVPHLSHTLVEAVRVCGRYLMFTPVVDTDGTPVGVMGWDDIVRFGLERGAGDPCWEQLARQATRPGGAITPIAGLEKRDLGRLRTVREVAQAMLRVPPEIHGQNDVVQYVSGDGIVTPEDLFRAVFGRRRDRRERGDRDEAR